MPETQGDFGAVQGVALLRLLFPLTPDLGLPVVDIEERLRLTLIESTTAAFEILEGALFTGVPPESKDSPILPADTFDFFFKADFSAPLFG